MTTWTFIIVFLAGVSFGAISYGMGYLRGYEVGYEHGVDDRRVPRAHRRRPNLGR